MRFIKSYGNNFTGIRGQRCGKPRILVVLGPAAFSMEISLGRNKAKGSRDP